MTSWRCHNDFVWTLLRCQKAKKTVVDGWIQFLLRCAIVCKKTLPGKKAKMKGEGESAL